MPGTAPPLRRTVAGPLLVLAFASYAALALFSGIDRASETQPDLAKKVPRLLASEALRSGGRAALGTGNTAQALQLGEAAVRDAPLDPASTALLGAARLTGGDPGGADRAFRIAAQLGWRVPYTQLYMMARALDIGDYRIAAMRLDALARQNPATLSDRRLFDPFERSAPGRAALAERLAANPPWLRDYAMQVADLPADRLAQRYAVLTTLAASGWQVGCTPIGAPVSRLIAQGAIEDAARLWRGHCPVAAAGLLYDGSFSAASLDQSESEFAWTFIGQSDVSVVIEPAANPPAHQLVIDSSASQQRQVLRQLVLLPQGRYRLSWQSDAESGNQVMAQFNCAPAGSEAIAPSRDAASRRWAVTVTMDRACPARWIGFAIKPGAANVRIADVRLDRVA